MYSSVSVVMSALPGVKRFYEGSAEPLQLHSLFTVRHVSNGILCMQYMCKSIRLLM